MRFKVKERVGLLLLARCLLALITKCCRYAVMSFVLLFQVTYTHVFGFDEISRAELWSHIYPALLLQSMVVFSRTPA